MPDFSTYKMGEVRALVAPMLGKEAEDLIGVIVIGVTADGPLLMHSANGDWHLVGALASVIDALAEKAYANGQR
jgi:hypothetical protein